MILENIEHIRNILYKGNEVFLKPITGNRNFHPIVNNLVGFVLGSHKDTYIIPVDHSEGRNVDKQVLFDLLKGVETIFTPNKKELLYYFKHKNIIDLTLKGIYDDTQTSDIFIVSYLYRKFGERPDVGKIIPLVKHYEQEFSTYNNIYRDLENLKTEPSEDFTNNISIPVYFLLEQHGIGINESFVRLFNPRNPTFNIVNDIVYTWYNPYNTTTRPTNAFNSVNFAAIPKKGDYRSSFRPQNDTFVEFDFDGYHLRLLADLIGYELTSEPAHTQIARLYFDKQDISEEEYDKAKQLNFQAIYGHRVPEHDKIELFIRLEQFIDKTWKEFIERGYVNAPISMKVFSRENLPDMNPKKLFNYIMQSLETSRNILVLKNLLEYLYTKKTKISLVTYDSILLDFSKEDDIETLEQIEKIITEDNKYPVKFKYGKDLNF
jgi:hypothetical protein